MGVVFLAIRVLFGGYFAWHGARHLDAYGRATLIACARARRLPLPFLGVPLSGLLLTLGSASLLTGLFPAAGVIALVSFLVPAAFLVHAFWRIADPAERALERKRFARNVALSIAAIACLFIPRPWPLTMGI